MAPTIKLTILLAVCAYATAQYDDERSARYIASETKATHAPPVAILKQINRHNEDGSYTYGYESGDGSFKIETKSPTGEVKGKYGYKDDTGKLRVIEYGANKYGFQPAGEGITVAPPTLVDETTRDQEGARPGKGQSGRTQYRAQPVQQAVDYDYEEPQQQQQQQYRPAPAPAPRPAAPPRHQQQYRPAAQAAPVPPRPSFFAGAAPVPTEQELFAPAPQPVQKYRPAPSPSVQYTQNFGPAPSQNNFAPDARFSQAPQQYQQPRSQQAPFSMLDQLLKEYALPQGGAAPLHDITFGTY